MPIPFEFGKFNPLDFEDFILQRIDEDTGPALSSALDDPNPWASYNEWNCFPPDVVALTHSEINYDGWKKMPSLQVHFEKRLLMFEPDADRNVEVWLTLNQWRYLISETSLICVYAAHLQRLEDGSELFILNRLKTSRGRWLLTDDPVCWL